MSQLSETTAERRGFEQAKEVWLSALQQLQQDISDLRRENEALKHTIALMQKQLGDAEMMRVQLLKHGTAYRRRQAGE